MEGKKTKNLTILITILLLFSTSPIIISTDNGLNTIYVDDDGGADFTHIQDAINASSNGDTIFVYNGNYTENVKVNKTIDLIGQDKDNTIIYGHGNEYVVRITANSVEINGFTIKNSGGSAVTDAGIGVFSNKNLLTNNIISKSKNAIFITKSSGNIISNNKITDNNYEDSDGISLWNRCNNTQITGNQIFSNSREGIWSLYSDNTSIRDNIIYKNGGNGIMLISDKTVEISNNQIESNSESGILLSSGINSITIQNNQISNNDEGITVIGGATEAVIKNNDIIQNHRNGIYFSQNVNDNTITENNIMFNGNNGIIIKFYKHPVTGHEYYCSDNQIFLNNIICNQNKNAVDECSNYWNRSIDGNYYDDWDGIGIYPIYGGENQDKHPLPIAHNITSFPPLKPKNLSGPINGRTLKIYTYSADATDPDNDKIKYKFDWGDGTNSSWLGPYDSADTVKKTKIWSEKGNYSVRVKAKDIYGYESPWSDPLIVTMPKSLKILERLSRILIPSIIELISYFIQNNLKIYLNLYYLNHLVDLGLF